MMQSAEGWLASFCREMHLSVETSGFLGIFPQDFA